MTGSTSEKFSGRQVFQSPLLERKTEDTIAKDVSFLFHTTRKAMKTSGTRGGWDFCLTA
jgi:hypothetical protein